MAEPQDTQQKQEQPTSEVIFAALNILFTVILPAVVNVVSQLQKNNVTLDDLRALQKLVKRPEEYFG
jgi:hypothetical protein